MTDTLPTEQILRLPQVKELTGLSRTTIYTLMEHNLFPQNIMLTQRNVGWIASEIQSWIADRIQAHREAARLHAS